MNIIVNYIIQYLKIQYFLSTYFFLNQTIPFPSHILASGQVTIPVQGIYKIDPGCGFHTLECIEQCFARQTVTDKLKHLNIWTLRCPNLWSNYCKQMSDPKKKTKCRLMWFTSHRIILICCDWCEFSISRGFQTLSVQIPLTRDRRRGRNSARKKTDSSKTRDDIFWKFF